MTKGLVFVFNERQHSIPSLKNRKEADVGRTLAAFDRKDFTFEGGEFLEKPGVHSGMARLLLFREEFIEGGWKTDSNSWLIKDNT